MVFDLTQRTTVTLDLQEWEKIRDASKRLGEIEARARKQLSERGEDPATPASNVITREVKKAINEIMGWSEPKRLNNTRPVNEPDKRG